MVPPRIGQWWGKWCREPDGSSAQSDEDELVLDELSEDDELLELSDDELDEDELDELLDELSEPELALPVRLSFL